MLRLFEAFSVQRWNDRIKPVELTEMDKQGFKTMLAFIFAKTEEEKGNKIDWDLIVYSSVFSLMRSIVLSDIKSPVIRKIKNNYPEEYKKLNSWVLDQYKPLFPKDEELLIKFENYLNDTGSEDELTLKVIRAAHKYSTFREFEIIKASNLTNPQLKLIEQSLKKDLKLYLDLEAMKDLMMEQDLYEAVCLIEQLRFQTRWNQTPRVPKTTVIGHSMYVATLMFFLSREGEACSKRMYNNFFAGLFHDLPEAVTRDIISPVKRATEKLPEIIKKIEDEVCSEELFPKLPQPLLPELYYLIGFNIDGCSEFSNRIIDNGEIIELSDEDSLARLNEDRFSPVDGRLIKLADEIAAFLEANQSIEHGITSRHLQSGLQSVKEKYSGVREVNGISIEGFFSDFE